jgi:hypothetical protein
VTKGIAMTDVTSGASIRLAISGLDMGFICTVFFPPGYAFW